MKLLGILFSCVCLQMAPGAPARAICLDPMVQRDPDLGPSAVLAGAEQEAAEFIPLSRSPATVLPEPRFVSSLVAFFGPKDFLIRTGLSPPLVIG